MRYAMTGITGYTPPGDACPGHRYDDRPDQDDPHMSVHCPVCEPYLVKDPSWAAVPSQVPLTEAEKKDAEEAEAKHNAVAAAAVANLAGLLGAAASNPAVLAAAVQGAATAPPAAPAPKARAARGTRAPRGTSRAATGA